MEILESYKLELMEAPESIKLGIHASKAVKVRVIKTLSNKAEIGIPIRISNRETSKKLCSAATNEFGFSACFLPSIKTDRPILNLEISMELCEYLNIEVNSTFYPIAINNNPVEILALDLKTEKPTVFVKSEELNQSRPMQIKTLEPTVKQTLAENGYNFVDKENDADFIVKINANTTTGSSYQGIHFAFLDANISIIETSSGEEIYKTHLDQIKGGGSDFKKAGKKAYITAAKEIKDTILKSNFIKE